jgi:hypothetical protein
MIPGIQKRLTFPAGETTPKANSSSPLKVRDGIIRDEIPAISTARSRSPVGLELSRELTIFPFLLYYASL